MKKNRFLSVLLLLIFVLLLTACQSQNNETTSITKEEVNSQNEVSTYPKVFIDSEGREVSIEKKPENFVSLSPALTELVADLGGNIIGRTSYCNYPASILEAEDVGSLLQPDFEKIIDLAPDLVVTTSLTKPEVITQLEDNNIKVVRILSEDSFEGIFKMIDEMGKLMDNEKRANEIISHIKEIVADIEEKTKDLTDKPTVYYMVAAGDEGDFAATGDTFIHEILELVGTENIAKDATYWAFSKEELIDKNPDIIITGEMSNLKDTLKDMPGYQDLDAVKNGHVYEFDSDVVDRTSPRIGEGIIALYEIVQEYLHEK